ncbi:MAG TPA: radical SAM protein [Deltaproteobacteria bacterium]|nr:radical SAM protein [Deltaproteobacteria bacterium]HXK46192.1 radical SAM protein [Deltaproteobacteria bacterium]
MKLPHILAWELTRACNLNCVHCRASATSEPGPGELSTVEGMSLLGDLASGGTRLVILSGGEALVRPDVFELAAHGTGLGLRMTLATNGSLVTPETAVNLRKAGIVRVSVSLDGVTPDIHDAFRGMPGAFAMAVRGIETLLAEDIPVQVNTTVAAMNISQMKLFPAFLAGLGVTAWHVFFLVPTGRGENVEPARVRQYREMLENFHAVSKSAGIECKATCAPQYYRMLLEREGSSPTKGCLAGTGFGFVSAVGTVQPCGFLQIDCGSIRKSPLEEIWQGSPLLARLRDMGGLQGKCGRCGYTDICGGCRARAYEVLGDVMETDPICWYPVE